MVDSRFVVILFLSCLLVVSNFAAGEGTITGVVLESRQDEDNRNNLLVEVKGDEDAGADRLEIKLKGAGEIEMVPFKLPGDWQWTWDGKILSAWGPETRLPLWLRFGLGDSPAPAQGDVEVFLNGKRAYRKKGIPVKPRPKVTVSDQFENIVQLPPRVSPGDVVEFEEEAIEKCQEDVARRHGYILTSHRLDLFGTCPKCQGKVS